ncbi:MAG: hypothetical protein R3B54_03190 [Bdellovibrionota bacterium]
MVSLLKTNHVRWVPTASALPTSHCERPSAGVTLTILVFACGVLGIFVAGAVGAYLTRGFRLGPFLAMFPVILASLGLCIYGIGRFFHTKTVTLSYNMIEYTEAYFFSKKYWREPIFHYLGIEKRSRHLTQGDAVSGKTEYELVLKHANPAREISLFYSYQKEAWEEASEQFAHLLNMKLIEPELPTLQSLPLHTRETDLQEFGNRIWIETSPDSHRVCHKRVWSSWPSSLGIIFTGFLYLSSSVHFVDGSGEVPLSILLAFFSVFFLVFLLQVFSVEELLVTRENLSYRVRYPWGIHTRKTLNRSTIAGIHINTDSQRLHLPSSVRIEGREGIIHFGRYTTEADKTKLRDFLLQNAVGVTVSHQLKEA